MNVVSIMSVALALVALVVAWRAMQRARKIEKRFDEMFTISAANVTATFSDLSEGYTWPKWDANTDSIRGVLAEYNPQHVDELIGKSGGV